MLKSKLFSFLIFLGILVAVNCVTIVAQNQYVQLPWPISLCTDKDYPFIPINATFQSIPTKGVDNKLNVTGYWKKDFQDRYPCVQYYYNDQRSHRDCDNTQTDYIYQQVLSYVVDIKIPQFMASGNYSLKFNNMDNITYGHCFTISYVL